MIDLRRYAAAAGPASLVLGTCVVIGGLIIMDGLHAGAFVGRAAEILWWPAIFFWALAAIVACRRRQAAWVVASAPLVVFPLVFYGLLVIYCWKDCEI